MANKASKTPFQLLLQSLQSVLYKDGNLGGAEDAGTVRDWSLTASIVTEKVGKRLEHNARSMQIIAAGLSKISNDLNNQVADIDNDIQLDLDEEDAKWGRNPSTGAWTDFQAGPDMEGYTPYYIVARDTNAGVIYYGPADRQTALDHLNAWVHPDADLTTQPGEDMEIKPISHFAHGLKPAKDVAK